MDTFEINYIFDKFLILDLRNILSNQMKLLAKYIKL